MRKGSPTRIRTEVGGTKTHHDGPYTIGLCKPVGAVPLFVLVGFALSEEVMVAQRFAGALDELMEVKVGPFHVDLGLKRHVQLIEGTHKHGLGR